MNDCVVWMHLYMYLMYLPRPVYLGVCLCLCLCTCIWSGLVWSGLVWSGIYSRLDTEDRSTHNNSRSMVIGACVVLCAPLLERNNLPTTHGGVGGQTAYDDYSPHLTLPRQRTRET
ncbi:hypothetical protein K504DRAFT_524655 [Pleomassaria siparia CBS 279.74]|uniref:Uncharacterized protein n=1 Tax=Pleomassaria siparia CBS 279.74 TaxID=1314801 RepID=A0A6G1KBS7_9PLEO|nr:hypothetical protein K504DRAFT_524655 [Pleomassaria siparia CBS 279.74]